MPVYKDHTDYPLMRAQAAVPRSPIYINALADSHVCAGLQCDGRLTRPPPWPTQRPSGLLLLRLTCSSAPVYNTAADSSVRSRGRLTVIDFNLTAVIINSAKD